MRRYFTNNMLLIQIYDKVALTYMFQAIEPPQTTAGVILCIVIQCAVNSFTNYTRWVCCTFWLKNRSNVLYYNSQMMILMFTII